MYEIFEKLLADRKQNINQVSKATGIPASTLYSWKSGVSQLKQDKLLLLAEYFGVTVSFLMGSDADKPKPSPVADLLSQMTPEQQERMLATIKKLQQLTERDRDTVEALIDHFIQEKKKPPTVSRWQSENKNEDVSMSVKL